MKRLNILKISRFRYLLFKNIYRTSSIWKVVGRNWSGPIPLSIIHAGIWDISSCFFRTGLAKQQKPLNYIISKFYTSGKTQVESVNGTPIPSYWWQSDTGAIKIIAILLFFCFVLLSSVKMKFIIHSHIKVSENKS